MNAFGYVGERTYVGMDGRTYSGARERGRPREYIHSSHPASKQECGRRLTPAVEDCAYRSRPTGSRRVAGSRTDTEANKKVQIERRSARCCGPHLNAPAGALDEREPLMHHFHRE
eukprot:GHVU01016983.1.p2 GENE.GHVU01016983.1~~GHVU01016983.1.p2  ORF type:complete len:115 (+),score=7.21 GHVU01016983.1:465-809(+)